MIKLVDPYIGSEERENVLSVLDSKYLVQGPFTKRLEERFASIAGTKYAIATSSGTTALHVALLAHGIGPGDEVITTPFTFMASASSILMAGATPVFVDIEPDTFNINARLIEQAITPSTKAIMPVHLFGQMADMHSISEIAPKHGLVVIEDACQSVGAEFDGKKAGSYGTGVFSLYATKNIMSGEGGIISTSDDDIYAACVSLRNHGSVVEYKHKSLGYNYRMSDLHAAIGVAQTDRLEAFTARRVENAAQLSAGLTGVITPQVAPNRTHVWHQYTIQTDPSHRDELARRLLKAGIQSKVFYPTTLNNQPLFSRNSRMGDFPVSERAAKSVLSIPVHPALSHEDVDSVILHVNQIASSYEI